MNTTRRLSVGLCVAALALLTSRRADGQVIDRFSLRGEIGAGVMTPTVQRETLGFDSAHLQLTGRIGFDVIDWLSLQLSVNNGFFFASGQQAMGRTLALQFGLRLQPAAGSVGRVWGDASLGYYSSGSDRHLGLDAGLGFEFNATRAFAVGPFARMYWIPADPAIHQPSDAFYLSFGLSFTLRIPRGGSPVSLDRDRDGVLDADDSCVDVPQGATPEPRRRGCPRSDRDHDGVFDDEDNCVNAPQGQLPDPTRRGCPSLDTDGDGVVDAQDLCVSAPAGPHPDAARRGCPLEDRDGDTVPDAVDLCPTEPQGATPDPARRGCPASDRDGDTVLDAVDQCPTEPQGATPDPARRGCPVSDRDQDGIVDAADRCPDRAETFNGREDTDGCPDGRALGTRAGGRIRISEQIRFATDSAEIRGRRSFAILDAVASILRVATDITMLHVEGHTDDQGDAAHNRDLSNRRAQSVIRELATRGIAATRLTAHGYGADRPLVQGSSRRARAANRRIEFRVDLDAPAVAATP